MEGLLKTTIDPTFKIPKILNEEIIHDIETIPLDEYRASLIPETEYVFKDIVVTFKGKFISPAALTSISLKFPELNIPPPLTYSIPKIKDKKAIQLPKYANTLMKYYNRVMVNNETNLNTDPLDASFWISLFCIYGKEFCALYDKYMTDPDDVVGVIEAPNEHLEKNFKISRREKQSSKSDIKATCHLIIISMNKYFAEIQEGRNRQIKIYLNNRKSAVYSSMRVPIGELVVQDSFFLQIGNVFRVLTKFKKQLFYFCYQNQQYPEFSIACDLLAYSAMRTIKLIIDFIYLPKKTLAHCEPVVLEEIYHFLTIARKKKNEDGALWPYHRILYPTDGELNAANFPNLAVSAIEYQKKYGNKSFLFMVTPPFPVAPGILEKAITLETRNIYTKPAIPFEVMKLMSEQL